LEIFNNNILIENSVISYYNIIQKDRNAVVNGKIINLHIQYIDDQNIILTGGKNNKYFEKYLKYKTKYLQIKNK
jgi:hypothetical protein